MSGSRRRPFPLDSWGAADAPLVARIERGVSTVPCAMLPRFARLFETDDKVRTDNPYVIETRQAILNGQTTAGVVELRRKGTVDVGGRTAFGMLSSDGADLTDADTLDARKGTIMNEPRTTTELESEEQTSQSIASGFLHSDAAGRERAQRDLAEYLWKRHGTLFAMDCCFTTEERRKVISGTLLDDVEARMQAAYDRLIDVDYTTTIPARQLQDYLARHRIPVESVYESSSVGESPGTTPIDRVEGLVRHQPMRCLYAKYSAAAQRPGATDSERRLYWHLREHIVKFAREQRNQDAGIHETRRRDPTLTDRGAESAGTPRGGVTPRRTNIQSKPTDLNTLDVLSRDPSPDDPDQSDAYDDDKGARRRLRARFFRRCIPLLPQVSTAFKQERDLDLGRGARALIGRFLLRLDTTPLQQLWTDLSADPIDENKLRDWLAKVRSITATMSNFARFQWLVERAYAVPLDELLRAITASSDTLRWREVFQYSNIRKPLDDGSKTWWPLDEAEIAKTYQAKQDKEVFEEFIAFQVRDCPSWEQWRASSARDKFEFRFGLAWLDESSAEAKSAPDATTRWETGSNSANVNGDAGMPHLTHDRMDALVFRNALLTECESLHLGECVRCQTAVDRLYEMIESVDSALGQPGVMDAFEKLLMPPAAGPAPGWQNAGALVPNPLRLTRQFIDGMESLVEEALTGLWLRVRPYASSPTLGLWYGTAAFDAVGPSRPSTSPPLQLIIDPATRTFLEFRATPRRAVAGKTNYDLRIRVGQSDPDGPDGIADAQLTLRAGAHERTCLTIGPGLAIIDDWPALQFDLDLRLPDTADTGTLAGCRLNGVNLEQLWQAAGITSAAND